MRMRLDATGDDELPAGINEAPGIRNQRAWPTHGGELLALDAEV
jgi:hypothetical protein